jgi:hypothetical protein
MNNPPERPGRHVVGVMTRSPLPSRLLEGAGGNRIELGAKLRRERATTWPASSKYGLLSERSRFSLHALNGPVTGQRALAG